MFSIIKRTSHYSNTILSQIQEQTYNIYHIMLISKPIHQIFILILNQIIFDLLMVKIMSHPMILMLILPSSLTFLISILSFLKNYIYRPKNIRIIQQESKKIQVESVNCIRK